MQTVPQADPAATVLLLRDREDGFEVLLVRRNARGFFSELAVFPGGGVDEIDVPSGQSPWGDAAHRRAALRELAEETGILLTADGARSASGVKGEHFYRWLSENDLTPAFDTLTLVSRWITPEIAPRRFDTRFYLAACDHVPDVVIDTEELVGFDWIVPRAALERHQAGELDMILPTVAHIRWLTRRTSVEDALASARGADGRTLIRPQRMTDGSLLPIHLPADTP